MVNDRDEIIQTFFDKFPLSRRPREYNSDLDLLKDYLWLRGYQIVRDEDVCKCPPIKVE